MSTSTVLREAQGRMHTSMGEETRKAPSRGPETVAQRAKRMYDGMVMMSVVCLGDSSTLVVYGD